MENKAIFLSSNAREVYKEAARVAEESPDGSFMVFTYSPAHIDQDLSLHENQVITIAKQVDDSDSYEAVRYATVISVDFYKNRLYITLKVFDCPVTGGGKIKEGKAVFTEKTSDTGL